MHNAEGVPEPQKRWDTPFDDDGPDWSHKVFLRLPREPEAGRRRPYSILGAIVVNWPLQAQPACDCADGHEVCARECPLYGSPLTLESIAAARRHLVTSLQ